LIINTNNKHHKFDDLKDGKIISAIDEKVANTFIKVMGAYSYLFLSNDLTQIFRKTVF